MRKSWLKALPFAAACVLIVGVGVSRSRAANVLIESWENTEDPTDGWVTPVMVDPLTTENPTWVISDQVTSPGVTNGTYALQLSGTDPFNYGQILRGPFSVANTALLAGSQTISIDPYAPNFGNDFGWWNPWTCVFNQPGGLGYVSLDAFNFTQYGWQSTMTWTIPGAVIDALNGYSGLPTQIIFQAGSGGLSGSTAKLMYVDNVRVNTPEPASFGLLAIGGLLALRRR